MSASRRKGTAAETAVVNYLRANGWPWAERRALNGSKDRGDITGLPGVVIEVKAAARTELAAWADELAAEVANDQADHGAIWHKRRGRADPGDWYVTMPGHMYVRLLADALQLAHPAGSDA